MNNSLYIKIVITYINDNNKTTLKFYKTLNELDINKISKMFEYSRRYLNESEYKYFNVYDYNKAIILCCDSI